MLIGSPHTVRSVAEARGAPPAAESRNPFLRHLSRPWFRKSIGTQHLLRLEQWNCCRRNHPRDVSPDVIQQRMGLSPRETERAAASPAIAASAAPIDPGLVKELLDICADLLDEAQLRGVPRAELFTGGMVGGVSGISGDPLAVSPPSIVPVGGAPPGEVRSSAIVELSDDEPVPMEVSGDSVATPAGLGGVGVGTDVADAAADAVIAPDTRVPILMAVCGAPLANLVMAAATDVAAALPPSGGSERVDEGGTLVAEVPELGEPDVARSASGNSLAATDGTGDAQFQAAVEEANPAGTSGYIRGGVGLRG